MKTIKIKGKTAEEIIAELLEAGFVKQEHHKFNESEVEHIKAWVKDLRANKRKACDRMIDPRGGRCCLMVAVDTAKVEGYPINRSDFSPNETEFNYFYGISSTAILFSAPVADDEDPKTLSFMELNDGSEFTFNSKEMDSNGDKKINFSLPNQPHSVIADLIEILLLGRDAPSHD